MAELRFEFKSGQLDCKARFLTAAQSCQRPACSFSAVLVPCRSRHYRCSPPHSLPGLLQLHRNLVLSPLHALQWLLHFFGCNPLQFPLLKSAYSPRLRPWPYDLSLSDPPLNKKNSNNIIIIAANTHWVFTLCRHYDYIIWSSQPCELVQLLSYFTAGKTEVQSG